MSSSSAPVQNQARPFTIDELFFSVTDPKGIILTGNEVFTRVSGYSLSEMIGEPHNLIRHPDMPRCVFKLLWDEIQAGRPIAAYVKNLAKDGKYYWVLATVVPIDGGYLSVRLKPSTAYFDAAKSIYQELLSVEQAIEGKNLRDRKPAMEAGAARLGEMLTEAGFPDYQAFMNVALPAEVRNRDAQLTQPATRRDRTVPASAESPVDGLLHVATQINSYVDVLLANVDQYGEFATSLTRKARYIADLSGDVGLFSLNALLASARAGESGAALSAVAGLLRSTTERSAPVFRELIKAIDVVADLLSEIIFPVAAAKVQSEVAILFARELALADGGEAAGRPDMKYLTACLNDGVEVLSAALSRLDEHVAVIDAQVGQLRRALDAMQALEINGRVEASRLSEAHEITSFFNSIGEQIANARSEVEELRDLASISFTSAADQAARLHEQISALSKDVLALDPAGATAA